MTQHEQIHCSQFPGSLVGPVFADQIEVTIRHHALEAGCFVVNATGWLTDSQIESITPTPRYNVLCVMAVTPPLSRQKVSTWPSCCAKEKASLLPTWISP